MTDKSTIKRPFQCTWPGCTNSYARSEHLNRHKLNHEPVKIYECEYCPKTFVRSDLLFRHKDRHARKALKRNSPTGSNLKFIRPARSDSNSSREDAGIPYMSSRGYDSGGSYTSSIDTTLSRSMSHPRSLLQSPFSSKEAQSQLQPSSFEEYATRHRSHTLPAPLIRPASKTGFSPHQEVLYGSKADSSVSPVLPPIRNERETKSRTYSVESMLNDPVAIRGSPFYEGVILE